MRRMFGLFSLISFIVIHHFAFSQCDTPPDDIFGAARTGDTLKVKKLLEEEKDINSEDVVGGTALYYAVQRNHKDIVELLIRSGADVNHRSTKDGNTALMAIHRKDNSESLQLLLDNGAEVNFKNHEGHTALRKASEYSNVSVLKVLINHGANINDVDEYGDNILVHCLRAPSQYQQDQPGAIRELISRGADVNQQNKFGKTAAFYAFYSRNLAILPMIVPKVQGKFWKDAVEDFKNALNDAELVQMYLDAGVDVNAGRELGWNFLMNAAFRGSAQTVQVLIQAGADVNTTDSYGTTPIVVAVGRDKPEMVRVLIAAGAKIEDIKNDLLQTALKAGYFDTAQVLLDAGAHVENQKELTLKGQIKQFLRKSDRVASECVFRTLQKEFPEVDRRDEIFQLGDLYLRQNLYKESIDIHMEIINLYPGSSSVLSAYYQIARAYEKMGLEFRMAKAYEDLLSYPVTNDNPSPYEIINVKSLAEEELAQYRRKHN